MPTKTDPNESNFGHRERLRQRFEKFGFPGLAEHEVVELLLTLCIPRRDVKAPAKALLSEFGSLKGILDASPESLRQIRGIGKVTPVALRIIRQAATLYLQQELESRDWLNSIGKVEEFWLNRLGGLQHEVFEVAYLDKAYRLLKDGVDRGEEGTVDYAHVYPRKIMESALRRAATCIVLIHNQPTGRSTPAHEDRVLTDELVKAGESLGIRVLDHLIIAGNQVFSFRREGLIPPLG